MPFTVSPSSYKGGDYLFQGITNAAQGITGAINQYAQIADQTTQSDALMKYLSQQNDPISGKPIIDKQALEDYQNHSMRQRAFVAGGMQAGMHLTDALQKLGYANRESLAHTNYYQAEAQKAQADAAGGGSGAPKGRIWSDELGGWATPAQADAAKRRSPAGYIKQAYGLVPEQIFDSSQHEAGTVATDPTTGAKTFKNDPAGDQIRIGGPTGVTMPKVEHEIYKRQLNMSGFVPGQTGGVGGAAGAGAAGGPAAAGQDPNQARAISILQQNGKPLTPGNIQYVLQQLSGGQ
jgi:hypothetical protein